MAATTRVEVRTDAPDLQDGLQARVHDPLWLLARQWQFGEFKGEDTGSPAAAQVVIETAPISRYQPGAASSTNGSHSYSPLDLALETLVEREPIAQDNLPNWRWATEAGLQLIRLLHVEGIGSYRSVFLKSNYLLHPPATQQRQALDGDSQRFLNVVGRRVVDGAQLYKRLASLRDRDALVEIFQESPFDTVSAADRPRVIRAITAWLTWYVALFSQAEDQSAWVSERIEYAFAVSGKTSTGEIVLAAPEYLEGHLDWHSFVAQPGTSLGAAEDASMVTTAFLPAPVSYRGMPSPRFWEFEDASVNFAKVQANPHDLARLLLVKFALEYGNDWFLVPLEIDIGSLCLIRSLIVANTFGERMLVPHTAEVDGENSPWRAFALSQASQPLFFLPPVLGPALQSAAVEDVLFLRDEMANVAWAVERVVESPAGRPLDRFEAFQVARQRRARDEESPAGGGAAPADVDAYRLGTAVPDYWIPLLPVQQGASSQLRRGVLPRRAIDGTEGVLEPQGRVLEPGQALLLHDEEVPREGARVTRAYQYARWVDGSTHLWIGRRKQPGRGEGSSGLQFDVLEAK
jgi:hypothetical protein